MKKKIVLIVGILAAAGLIGFKIMLGSPETTVEASQVTKGSIAEYVEETGTLMLEEETAVYSAASGKVIEVAKKAGESVKAGEVLVRLDNSEILMQIKALEAQRLGIAAKYEEARESTEAETILILNANLKAAEAQYEESKRQLDNNRTLYEAGAISLDVYKSSIAKLAADEAGLETARNNLSLAERGISENVKKQFEAQLSELQATLEQLKLKSGYMTVKSPIDGLVMSVDVKEGNIVQAGTKLYDIGGDSGYYFESNVLIEDLEGILVGSPVIIEDEDLGIKDARGAVRKIHPRAESVTSDLGIEQKRVKVEIDLDKPLEGLRPGYEATVRIITQSKADALLIPEKAVFDYQGKSHVFVNEGGIARLRVIEKGLESDEQVEVLTGLKEGELVVLSPDDTLEEGTKIK